MTVSTGSGNSGFSLVSLGENPLLPDPVDTVIKVELK